MNTSPLFRSDATSQGFIEYNCGHFDWHGIVPDLETLCQMLPTYDAKKGIFINSRVSNNSIRTPSDFLNGNIFALEYDSFEYIQSVRLFQQDSGT